MTDSNETPRTAPFAALLGWVLGSALQLQQPTLWPALFYMAFVLSGLVAYALVAIKIRASALRLLLVVVGLSAVGLGVTGLRSVWFLQSALNPALEGRDVRVTAVVAGLPQRNESGLRFRLAVEEAVLDGQPIRLPPRIDVAWYGGVYPLGSEQVGLQRPPPELQAGERWAMTLRLKAGHGSSNPHGFDYELYLWEQGV